MRLSREQYEEFQIALLDAFGEAGLKEVVKYSLDKNLEAIAGGNNLTEIVFNLINWTDKHGKAKELAEKAHELNSGNEKLKIFVEKLRNDLSIQSNFSKAKIYTLPPVGIEFEKFKGRGDLLAGLRKQLIETQTGKNKRLVFLTGNAGIGKSTLAYHFAETYKEDKNYFKDGIIGLRVDSYQGKADPIARDFIEKYDNLIDLENEKDFVSLMKEKLASKQVLLILDNAQRPSPASDNSRKSNIKDIIHALFSEHSKCAVIVTTRDRNLSTFIDAGGHTIDLPKLEGDESLELLKDFMEKEKFEEDEEKAAREIVSLVDRLPLALKIVGRTLNQSNRNINHYVNSLREEKNKLGSLSLANYEDQVDWSVEASLNLSLELISGSKREETINFFYCLSICAREGFSQTAAMAASGYDREITFEYLNHLYTLSLVDASKDNREHYVLHSLVYSFALKRLQNLPSLYEQARERHARFFFEKIRILGNNKDREDVAVEKGEILLALEWFEELFLRLPEIQNLRQSKRTIKRFLLRHFPTFLAFLNSKSLPEEYEYWNQVAEGLNGFFEKYIEPEVAAEVLSIFQTLAEDMEDWQANVSYCLRRAKFLSFLGDLSAAETSLESVPKTLGRITSRAERQRCRVRWKVRLGRILWKTKRITEASKHLRHSVEISKNIGDRKLLRNALDTHGEFLWQQNELSEATENYRQVVKLSKNLGKDFDEQYSLLKSLIRLDILLQLQGKHEEAKQRFQDAIKIAETVNCRKQLAQELYYLGKRSLKGEAAVKALERQVEVSATLDDHYLLAIGLMCLASKLTGQGKLVGALPHLKRATGFHATLDDQIPLVGSLRQLGQSLRKEQRFDEAIDAYQCVIQISRDIEEWRILASGLNALGWLKREKGCIEEAIQAFLEQIEIGEKLRDRTQISFGNTGLSSLLNQQTEDFLQSFECLVVSRDSVEEKRVLISRIQYWNKRLQSEGKLDLELRLICFFAKFSQEFGSQQHIISASMSLGGRFIGEGKLEEAFEAFKLAAKVAKDTEAQWSSILGALRDLVRRFTKQKKLEKALETAYCLIEAAEAIGDQQTKAIGYSLLGVTFRQQGNIESALEAILHQLEIVNTIKDKKQARYITSALLGLLHQQSDKFLQAFQQIINTKEALSEKQHYIKTLKYLSKCKYDDDKFHEAFKLLQLIAEFSQELDNEQYIISTSMSLGGSFLRNGELKDAFDAFKLAGSFVGRGAENQRVLGALQDMAKRFRSQENLEKSVEAAYCLIEVAETIGKRKHVTYGLEILVQLLPQMSQLDGLVLTNALEALQRNLSLIANKRSIVATLFTLGGQFRRDSRFEESLKVFLLLSGLRGLLKEHEKLTRALRDLGKVLSEQGKLYDAQQAYEQVILISRDSGDQQLLAAGYNLLGKIQKRQQNLEGAEQAFLEQIRIGEILYSQNESDVGIKQIQYGLNGLSSLLKYKFNRALNAIQLILNVETTIDEQNSRTSTSSSFLKHLDEALQEFKNLLQMDYILISKRLLGQVTTLEDVLELQQCNEVDGAFQCIHPFPDSFKEQRLKAVICYLRGQLQRLWGLLLQKGELEKDGQDIKIEYQEKYKLADHYFNESNELAQELGDLNLLAEIYVAKGQGFFAYGDDQKAKSEFVRSYEIYEHLENVHGIEIVVPYLFSVLVKLNLYNEAWSYYERACAVAPESISLQKLRDHFPSRASFQS